MMFEMFPKSRLFEVVVVISRSLEQDKKQALTGIFFACIMRNAAVDIYN
jgi:hypothetical protein